VTGAGEQGETGVDRWTEALTWYVRMREPEARHSNSAVGRAWRDWYAHADNRHVFEDLSRLLADRKVYGKRLRPSRAELENDRYDLSVSVVEWRRARVARTRAVRPPVARLVWWLSGGIGIAAITVLFALLPLQLFSDGGAAGTVFYQTPVGGLEHVRLPDGSSIILGGSTKLSVTFSGKRRSVTLMNGQAWFKVAHDLQWPFVVSAGDGRITDVGTAFLVTRESDRIIVTVIDGTVQVAARPLIWSPLRLGEAISERQPPMSARLSRGEGMVVGDNGALSHIRPADTHAAVAWTRGQLTFDDQPLRYVIENVNRYSSRHIAVTAAAGTLRFSGIVSDQEIRGWLHGLQMILPVVVDERGKAVCVRMRVPTHHQRPSALPCVEEE
jgi:transmembrane sensor